MKKLKSVSLFLFATLVFAGCSSVSGKNAGQEGGGTGNASFSALVDGTNFSSNTGTDNLNAAFHMKGEDKHLFFMLCDPDNPVQKLNFDVPAKVGSTTVAILPKYAFEGYVNKDFAAYDDDGVTITINSISDTRVSGTFSGTYKAEGNYPKAKPSVVVTDGKFDIPFSTSAQWKKMYNAE
jgi:hypothetical protein